MMTIEETCNLIDRYGLPLVGLIVVVILAWAVLRFLARKLFDDEKGLLTRVTNRHLDFVDKTEKLATANTESFAVMTSSAVATERSLKDIHQGQQDSREMTARFKRAAVNGCAALNIACEELGIQERTRPYLDAIKRELEE